LEAGGALSLQHGLVGGAEIPLDVQRISRIGQDDRINRISRIVVGLFFRLDERDVPEQVRSGSGRKERSNLCTFKTIATICRFPLPEDVTIRRISNAYSLRRGRRLPTTNIGILMNCNL
jgi:hypothetical protein